MSFLIFIAAVIALGVFTIKLKRKNAEGMNKALKELLYGDDMPPEAEEKPSADSESKRYFVPEERDLGSLVIPQDFMFGEQIEMLRYMAEKYPDEVSLELYAPVSREALGMFERRNGFWLTNELKELYGFTNGLRVNNGTLQFDSLENIETDYKTGYCDWLKDGDAMDYLLLGSVIGDGECVVMEKRTGHIFRYFDGEMTDCGDIGNVLDWVIEFVYTGHLDKDEKIEKYLEK